MKTRVALYTGAVWLFSALMLATLSFDVDAQSAEDFHARALAAAQTRPPATTGSLRAGAARGVDEYRLVFPRSYAASNSQQDGDIHRAAKFDDLVEQLNEAGAEGYRLASFVYNGSDQPVGLVRRAGVPYEYEWLYLDGGHRVGVREVTIGFDDKYAEFSKKGFRLADYSYFENYCSPPASDVSDRWECKYSYVFLLEREKGVERPARHAFAAWGHDPEPAFLTEVRRILADGYLPKHALPLYMFWFEPAEAGGVGRVGDADLEVLGYKKAYWGTDQKKRINELAKRGYRIALADWNGALMYRPRGEAVGHSYVWVKADKNLERRLAQMQVKGALYLKTYEEDELVFEQRAVEDGTRREYRALRFEFRSTKDASKTRVHVELTPASKERLTTLERLTAEGFVVRDLFLTGEKVGAILERPSL